MDNLSRSIKKASAGKSRWTLQAAFVTGRPRYFNDEGGLGEIWGAPNSAEIKSALNHLDWRAVPLPGSYNLRMRGLLVNITIADGEPTLTFTML